MYAPNLSDVLEAAKKDPTLLSGCYTPPAVELESGVPLTQWSVRQVKIAGEETTHHFVGFNNNSYDGRVSSNVVGFDKKTMVGVTASGRTYQLIREPGSNRDAEYVWNRWMSLNGVKPEDVVDVTDQYIKARAK